MAPLKFRAWDMRSGRMSNPFDFCCFDGEAFAPNGDWGDCWIYGDKTIVMQSTGLKDSKGVEIFEGDVVMFANDFEGSMYPPEAPEPHNDFAEVAWDNQFATFLTHAKGEYNRCHDTMPLGQRMDEYGDMEVIGNIYENPDLLPSPL